MTNDHNDPRDAQDADGRQDNTQVLAKIQHSRADNPKARPEPKKAAIVADPRNRLADGKVDTATGEVKPASA